MLYYLIHALPSQFNDIEHYKYMNRTSRIFPVDQTHLTFSCRFRCANYDDQSETSYEQVDCQCNYRSKWNNQGTATTRVFT